MNTQAQKIGIADFPAPLDVAIYRISGIDVICIDDLPEPYRASFREHQFLAATIARGYAYLHDYKLWLNKSGLLDR